MGRHARDPQLCRRPDPDGGYTVVAPALPGVVTEGASLEEALTNARDAIQLCLEDLAGQGLESPRDIRVEEFREL